MDDDAFVRHVGDRLAELPGVEAVTLGGSRAEGTSRPDRDWDFSLYYRGRFESRALRDVGWPGEVSEIDGRRSDVHYRDLDVVEREIAAAREGRFTIRAAPVPPGGPAVVPGSGGARGEAGARGRPA